MAKCNKKTKDKIRKIQNRLRRKTLPQEEADSLFRSGGTKIKTRTQLKKDLNTLKNKC